MFRDCTACPLHENATQKVFGSGETTARIMIIGEAPGAKEDEQGKPFVGEAGDLLTELIAGIGLTRADVYITNTNICRPPKNRDPKMPERKACFTRLKFEVEMVQPDMIIFAGRTAESNLNYRHSSEFFQKYPHAFMFHPASICYRKSMRGKIEEQLQHIKRKLKERDFEDAQVS